MKYAIVTTTIFVPKLLEAYVDDVLKYKHDCFFVVIGDKKTPIEAEEYCAKLAKRKKVQIIYMNVPQQEEYMKDFPELHQHLPYNSIQRRNIAILHAYRMGAETIMTIDDDNFLVSKDFVGGHAVGHTATLPTVASNTGWFNVCTYLKEEFGRNFFHRGHAPEFRTEKEKVLFKNTQSKIVVNAGLWLGDPDVDALTRLYYLAKPINAVAYNGPAHFTLAKGTWSTFNSQNTSLSREIIPAYFLSPMIGRYDDIWAAYVIKKITDHFGHSISFGKPIVKQERNPHNYWKDLAKESDGMQLTLRFVDALKSIKLTKKTYAGCYQEIVTKFALAFEKVGGPLTPEHQAFFDNYLVGMNVWIDTFKRLETLGK